MRMFNARSTDEFATHSSMSLITIELYESRQITEPLGNQTVFDWVTNND